jgi:hypothetical protein
MSLRPPSGIAPSGSMITRACHPVRVPDRQVHGQVAAPRVAGDVDASGSGGVEEGDRIGGVPADVERPAGEGRSSAASGASVLV